MKLKYDLIIVLYNLKTYFVTVEFKKAKNLDIVLAFLPLCSPDLY